MRGIYLQLKQFYSVQRIFYIKIQCRCLSRVQFSFFFDFSFKISLFFLFKKNLHQKYYSVFIAVNCSQNFYQRPQNFYQRPQKLLPACRLYSNRVQLCLEFFFMCNESSLRSAPLLFHRTCGIFGILITKYLHNWMNNGNIRACCIFCRCMWYILQLPCFTSVGDLDPDP